MPYGLPFALCHGVLLVLCFCAALIFPRGGSGNEGGREVGRKFGKYAKNEKDGAKAAKKQKKGGGKKSSAKKGK